VVLLHLHSLQRRLHGPYHPRLHQLLLLLFIPFCLILHLANIQYSHSPTIRIDRNSSTTFPLVQLQLLHCFTKLNSNCPFCDRVCLCLLLWHCLLLQQSTCCCWPSCPICIGNCRLGNKTLTAAIALEAHSVKQGHFKWLGVDLDPKQPHHVNAYVVPFAWDTSECMRTMRNACVMASEAH
jgi:hypothetical protein